MTDLLPDLLQVLAVVLTVGFVAALAMAGYEFYSKLYQRYLTQLGTQDAALLTGAPGSGGTLAAVRGSLVAFLASANERWVSEKRLAQIEASLRKAGKPLELKATEIVAFMELSAAIFLLLGVAVCWWLDVNVFACLIFALFGATYPLIWLRDKVKARHHAITRALPYNLDLLTLSVEAGLVFAAALGTGVDMGRKGPQAEELATPLRDVR